MANQNLPFNTDAEKAILGSAILSKEALYNVVSSLEELDFYVVKHQKVYRSILSLITRKQPVDVLTLATELESKKDLTDIGGAIYLQELTDSMISFGNLQFYIDIVLDLSIMRKMLTTVRTIDTTYLDSNIDNPNDFILKSEQLFKDSIARRRISSFIDMTTATGRIKQMFDEQKELSPDESVITGLTTGYSYIDNLTQGFQKGELTIVAARPSVGKTALALNFAYNVATKENVPVAIFSLEMTTDLLVKRLIASQSGVSLKNVNSGRFYGSQERAKVAAALNEVGHSKIFIDDASGTKILDIIAKTRKLQSANPDLGLVIIDYLGLVQTAKTSKNPDSRQEEVRKMSLALKEMAKELKIPVVVVSQLSRDVEKRDTKKPMLSDLRDSGSIEQDADVVMLIYREDYYAGQKKKDVGSKKTSQLTRADRFELARQQKEKELGAALPGNASFVELNVAKNRNGATGIVPLFFYKDYGRFEEPTKVWIDAMKEIEESTAAE